MHLTVEELRKLGEDVFRKAGVPDATTRCVVDALVKAELDGMPSHGFSRIPFYVDQALSGKVKADATPVVTRPTPACVMVDAGFGFAFPAVEQGLSVAMEQAQEMGIAFFGVHNSHHCGVLGLYAEEAARKGFMALIFSNTPAAMAPWNGCRASFGTNPIAFGCPREGKDPIVVDMSLSKVARGKIMNARQQGKAIPEGWALDAQGKPTTDPEAAMKGTMIPVGDAKGAALAMIVEILAAALPGANYAFQASSFFTAEGPAPAIGQSGILIAPGRINSGFGAHLEELCTHMLDQDGVRLSGARRMALRQQNLRDGVNLNDALYADLVKRAG